MLRGLIVCLLAVFAALPAAAQPKQKVIASFSILADITRQVGGDAVEVSTLVPALGDAHVYQPAPADARAVAGADLLVANGLNFETWLDRLVKASGFKGPRVIASTGIKPRQLRDSHEKDHGHKHGHSHGAENDPHIWHDLRRMQVYVKNIAEGLAQADPANAAGYRQRGQAYIAELEKLDDWASQAFGAIPAAHRKAISQHDAFGYLADRYDIQFLAPQGMNTKSEASAEAVGRLIRQIRQENIQAVFFESITNPRLIEQIAGDAKVKIGGRLYSDALSPPGSEADTYLKMYRLNVERLVEAMRRPN